MNDDNAQRTIGKILEMYKDNPEEQISLSLCTGGGDLQVALGFYDLVRSLPDLRLKTIGLGYIYSAGLVILLSGSSRMIARHATVLIHDTKRSFSPADRTLGDIKAIETEFEVVLKNYCHVVTTATQITEEEFLVMKQVYTVVQGERAMTLGIVDSILLHE